MSRWREAQKRRRPEPDPVQKAPAERIAPFRQYIMLKIRTGGVAMPPFGIAMPSFKDALSEDHIALLAAYLLPD
jgi:hypothetical protein